MFPELALQTALEIEPQKVRLAASLLLVAYLVVAIVILPRELSFIRSVEEPFYRRSFAAQDLLIQLGVLLVLLPCIAVPTLLSQVLWPYAVIVSGLAVLWGGWLWAAVSRYAYTYRILAKSTQDFEQRHTKLLESMKKEKERHDGS